MIKNWDIICFGNDWDSDPISKHHVATRLARENRVLWVSSMGARNPRPSTRDARRIFKKLREFFRGARRVDHNIHVFTPLVIPFHGSRLARWINRRWLRWSLMLICRRLGFKNLITWTFTPSCSDVAGTLGEALVVYHCVDEFSEFSGARKADVLEIERRLIEKSDLVIACSARLFESKRRYNPNTRLVTHGVDLEHFREACSIETAVPEEIHRLRHPVIGFHGLIADWVDLDLIAFLARSKPDWSFVLIGKLDTDPAPVRNLPNVHLLGRKRYAELPSYCKGFDLAILPFVVNELTLASNPLKLREYLAAGLPVVSTAIPEAEKLNGFVKIARTRRDFLDKIEHILGSGRTGPQLSISRVMYAESWDAKVEEMCRILEDVHKRKLHSAGGSVAAAL